jgi:hypothetical protein
MMKKCVTSAEMQARESCVDRPMRQNPVSGGKMEGVRGLSSSQGGKGEATFDEAFSGLALRANPKCRDPSAAGLRYLPFKLDSTHFHPKSLRMML